MLPFEGTPVTEPLPDADRTRIAERLDALSSRGVDVDDLAAIGAAYDAARAEEGRDSRGEGADLMVDLFAVAIGEHLARHSARSGPGSPTPSAPTWAWSRLDRMASSCRTTS